MKSFEEWAKTSPTPRLTWEDVEAEHGDVLIVLKGKALVNCCCCRQDFAISDFIDPVEFDRDTPETFYCGGSERCCP